MQRYLLIATGILATGLAIAGAVLPGLPTTPFLLVALWAFARSSERLYNYLEKMPLLRTALAEAHRFEEKRTIKLSVKFVAVSIAWGSAILTAVLTSGQRPLLLALVVCAAVGASIFMWWIPTESTVSSDQDGNNQ